RRMVRCLLIAGALAVAAISFLVHYRPDVKSIGEWVTLWNRDLNFTAAVFDLALWALLIAQRHKDHQLLLLSGGLGIQFTGEAIGASIVQFALQNRSKGVSLVGSVVRLSASLVFLYIWWQALRQTNEQNLPRASARTST